MKILIHTFFLLSFSAIFILNSQSQTYTVLDTLAFQNFDTVPGPPYWAYSGTPNAFNNGYTTAAMSPANSPMGLNGSWAWNVTTVSGGNPLTFNNISITPGYDSIRFSFRLAAMDLLSNTGGPDDLDYVLVEYSTNNGTNYYGRLRIRGAVSNNSTWAYDATGVASVYYQPTTEVVFQPNNSGLQTTEGYSFCQITFPGNITDLMVRVTPRSSSSTDTWLLDNFAVTGEKYCTPATNSLNVSSCGNYLSPAGNTYTTSGIYTDTLAGSSCDSIITINLTVNNSTTSTITPVMCNSYTSPSGNYTWNSTGVYTDTITNAAGCDSVITINLTINNVNSAVIQSGYTLTADAAGATYQWIDCSNNQPVSGAMSQSFTAAMNGNFAVIITENGCTDTSSCYTISGLGVFENNPDAYTLFPNPTQGEITIKSGNISGLITVEILTPLGQAIQTKSFANTLLAGMTINGPAGLYLIRITDQEGNRHVQSVIKQ